MDKKELTRRDFLKLAGASALTLVGANIINDVFAKTPSPDFNSDLYHKYEGKAAKIIKRVWVKYGIQILSQKEYYNEPNLPWPTDAIECLADALAYMPEDIFKSLNSPTHMFLMRKPGTNEGYANHTGGIHAGRVVGFFIPESFDINGDLPEDYKKVYFTPRNQMKATLCHELVHGLVEDQPGILTKYKLDVGWLGDESTGWKNKYAENLINEGEASKSPSEDFATAAGRMLVNSGSLSDDRVKFFKETPPFSKWVIKHKLV